MSRALASADVHSVQNLRAENCHLVLGRLGALRLARVTADFDGSVQSTGRHTEGTAVGFNKKKKGSRSYYPLFGTIAQTGQVLDVHHRPGNVHDSNGTGVEFTPSLPFERLPALKSMVEGRRRWRRIDEELSFFESQWKSDCWSEHYRFVFIRKHVRRQHKEPNQLDLFVPHEEGYDFKVIVTNKRMRAKRAVTFDEGRGSQEGSFVELMSHCQMDYVPVTTRVDNQVYLLSAMLVHNLTRELLMIAHPPQRGTTAKRTAFWAFEKLQTMRRNLIQRAGRLLRPGGKLVLSMNKNAAVESEKLHYLDALKRAA